MASSTRLLSSIAVVVAGVVWCSGANAVPFTDTIGDNDGYGVGIPDNGDTGTFATVNTDNRSAAEAAAVNGAQFTDVYSALYPGQGPNLSESGSFLFSPFGATVLSATLTIDMADFQATTFGPIAVDINGVALSLAFEDGFQKSVVRDFVLDAATLAAVNAAGFLSLNLDHTGSVDFIGFDFLTLSADVAAIPVPASLPLLAGAFILLGGLCRRRRSQAALRA